MNIRCPRCAEPWDMESLHAEVQARFPTTPWIVDGHHDQARYTIRYEAVAADFRQRGCEAMTGFAAAHNPHLLNSEQAEIASHIMELLGEDMDDAAAMFDDLDQLEWVTDNPGSPPPAGLFPGMDDQATQCNKPERR